MSPKEHETLKPALVQFSSEFSGGFKEEQFESRSLLLNKALLTITLQTIKLSHGMDPSIFSKTWAVNYNQSVNNIQQFQF